MRKRLAAAYGGRARQNSGHNPARAKLPVLAGGLFAHYDAGYDITQWYTAARDQPS